VKHFLFLFLTVFSNIIGHILVKQSSTENIRSIYFPAGICFFGISVFFYRIFLKYFPLNKAFLLLNGSTYILLGVLSVLFFKERFSWNLLLGYSIVMIGLFIGNFR
jgi:multidrug transporter EmrE-like cation transporter